MSVLGPLPTIRQSMIDRYCRRQAILEIQALLDGMPFEWVEFDRRPRPLPGQPDPDYPPLDFFQLTK